ncbi:MAG: Asparagine--tRNA ligase [Chlamydiae bacterium]|nr:Asparagine--tRNA ligase [Chlamydiota bacterium]
MNRTKIKQITIDHIGKTLKICGWVRSIRDQKSFAFIEVNDGSRFKGLQVVAEEELRDEINLITTGTSVAITGTLAESPGQNQSWELKAEKIEIFGTCPAEDYPLQKKRHSFEFLRTIAHLRPRTNTQGAVARVRSALCFATHQFFHDRDFLHIHTPVITSSDTEGAGEQFLVSTIDYDKPPRHSDGKVDYTKDFFGRPAYLTVSGQLNAEAMACALSDVYTFGPTFRAENSHTSRHLAEFWMMEPEMAFCDLEGNMDMAESYTKAMIHHLLEHCSEDLNFFDKFIEKGLLERLKNAHENDFARLTYTEAIDVLKKSGKSFAFPVEWGIDLQSEHERFLAEEHCKKPLFLTDYPESIKAFYMRANDDGKTVAALDLLVPKIGELIGGSQREERLDQLEKKILAASLDPNEYWWYLQLRKYGTVPHSGFGVGFERLIQFVSGIENIRDVIPFPRYPGHSDF